MLKTQNRKLEDSGNFTNSGAAKNSGLMENLKPLKTPPTQGIPKFFGLQEIMRKLKV